MAVITQIRRNVRNAERCSIYVDDAFFAACHMDVAANLGLRKGLEITLEIESRLRKEDRAIVLRQKIYSYATYKPRTEHQVRHHLRGMDVEDDFIEVLMLWLKEFRLVDDVAYAERFVSASIERKPLSPVAIRTALLRKGIPDTIIENVVRQNLTSTDIDTAAMSAAEKKLRMIGTAATPKERKDKLTRFLQSRGYSWDVIKHVLATLPIPVLMLVAITATAQPINCVRIKLPETINRFQPVTQPVLSHDGTALFIDRKLYPMNTDGPSDPDDVWCSLQKNGRWSEPERLGLTTRGIRQPDVLFNFTSDGLCALVTGKYRKADTTPCFAILYRHTAKALFDSVSVLDLGQMSANYYGHLSDDRRTLILALARTGGNGDLDLYQVRLCHGSDSVNVTSLGSTVNTVGFEGAPWLAHDMRTLYFSTNARDDKRGKADFYVTRRTGDSWTEWTTPVNMGTCFNTTEEETAFSLSARQDSAYVTSWDAGTGRAGIFVIRLDATQLPQAHATLVTTVIDAISGERISHATLHVSDAQGCDYSLSLDTATGTSRVAVPQRTSYQISAMARGYITRVQKVNIRGLDSNSTLKQTVRLFPSQRPILSLFFERGSAELDQAQRTSLDSLVRMADIRDISIMVQGYTDVMGSVALNQSLSVQRAENVRNMLLALGLTPERLVAEGRGVERTQAQSATGENPTSRRVDIFVR